MTEYELRSPETPSEWENYHYLCWEVMRKPWNQPKGSERDPRENDSWHRAVYSDGQLAGIARLQLDSPALGRVRFMAVAPAFQGKGIGRMLMASLEEIARAQGVEKIVLDAREQAVGFYLVIGYQVVAEGHLLYGEIQHYVMEKALYE